MLILNPMIGDIWIVESINTKKLSVEFFYKINNFITFNRTDYGSFKYIFSY